jgi:hypothetical protein
MVKRKNKTRRIKQASKDYNKNNKNNSNSTEGNKRQSDKGESSPSTSLAQRETATQETVPQLFDSLESHGTVEIKNSISMQEKEKDMKKALSTTERKQPERTEIVNTETTDNNVNTDLPVINPLIEQQASMVRESKEDEMAKTGITISDYKKIQNIESYRKQGNLDCPNIFTTSISLWQNYTMAWIVTYKEFARNTGRMAEYWYRLFWKPSSAKEEYHQQ